MKKLKYIIIAFLSVILTFSCESILEPTVQGQLSLDDLLSTENGIITAVNGSYKPLLDIYKGEQQIPFLTDMASDDGWSWMKESEPDFFLIDPTSVSIQNTWSNHYQGITRANTVLNNMQHVDFTSSSMKNAIEGQMKFLRAFYYFNLVRLFGEIPLIVNEIKDREDAEQPRASIEEVYIQIKKDLDDAISLLPASYSGGLGIEVGRGTSYAAIALKSLVHLELEEWDDVVQLTNIIKDKGHLLSNYADNFNGSHENGSSIFFEVQYGGVTNETTTTISVVFAPVDFQGIGIPLPTDDNLHGKGGGISSGNGFVQIFEEGDLRKNVIIDGYNLNNFVVPSQPQGSLYYVNKYYNTDDPKGLSTWNYPLIRYAEILLIRAEALNEIGYIADGEAFELLNKTRINAGIAPLTSFDLPNQSAFRAALRKERRIELAFETKRYFDLNRWGIFQETIQFQMDFIGLTFPSTKLITHPITGKKYFLYPIPNIEFANNANLRYQNPGY